MTRIGGWVVACPAFTVGPFATRDAAERRMAEIVRLGACCEPDAVEETP